MLLGCFLSKGDAVHVILKMHVSFRSIDSKHSPHTDLLIKMKKLSPYFNYKKLFSLPAVCPLQ